MAPIAVTAAVLFAFRSTLLSAGIPDFRHDWRWPYVDVQLRTSLSDVLRVWSSSGLGVPHALVVNHPALWIVHWLALIFPSRSVLAFGLVTTTALLALGVSKLARVLGVNVTIATCAGIVAALGAPMFDKFVAGHWYYMISVAAVPWAIASAVRYEGKSLSRAALTGSLVALAALQVQLWIITLCICIALLMVGMNKNRRRSAADLLLLIATGTVLTIPEIYGVVAAHSAERYSSLQTIPLFESNNSAPFSAAVIGLGYAPGYAETALARVPWAIIFLWAVPLAACAGAFIARRERKVNVLTVAWLALLALVAGVRGPLAAPIAYSFAHFPWTSTFRELHHFAEPMWILAVVLATVFMQSLRRRAGAILSVVAALGILALWAPADYGGTLRSWDFAGKSAALFAQGIPAVPARYLLTPSIQPVGPFGTSFDGADPDAAVNRTWFPENDPEQFGIVGVPLLMGERNPRQNAGWLRAAGVSAVLPRPYLVSKAITNSPLTASEKHQAEQYFHAPSKTAAWSEKAGSLLELRSDVPVVRDPFTTRFDDGFLLERDVFVDTHDPDAVPPTMRAAPVVSRDDWNPARTWVGASYWWWLDPQLAFWPRSVFTWSNRPLQVPPSVQNGYVHVVVFAGRLFAGQRAVSARKGVAAWLPLHGAHTVRVRDGAAMVIEFAVVQPPYRLIRLPAAQESAKTDASFSPDCACGTIRVSARHQWIVLKQSYNDGWRVILENGKVLRHVIFAGYGNAWEIQSTPEASARVEYAPAMVWQILVGASIIVWLLVALLSTAALLWPR
ncbi:MAG TPA: hypothetical protein VFW34_08720 [Candidatus Rubrimentiphilum sp.]|nr:hypothetical protein [Candidatus Rubrimentiphilum sp.]